MSDLIQVRKLDAVARVVARGARLPIPALLDIPRSPTDALALVRPAHRRTVAGSVAGLADAEVGDVLLVVGVVLRNIAVTARVDAPGAPDVVSIITREAAAVLLVRLAVGVRIAARLGLGCDVVPRIVAVSARVDAPGAPLVVVLRITLAAAAVLHVRLAVWDRVVARVRLASDVVLPRVLLVLGVVPRIVAVTARVDARAAPGVVVLIRREAAAVLLVPLAVGDRVAARLGLFCDVVPRIVAVSARVEAPGAPLVVAMLIRAVAAAVGLVCLAVGERVLARLNVRVRRQRMGSDALVELAPGELAEAGVRERGPRLLHQRLGLAALHLCT